MIDIGIDESGSKNNLLVLSAVAGQTAAMKKLKVAWEVDLERVGVDFFHAKDHWNRRAKPYHRISMTKRDWLLRRLIGHIHKYTFGGFAVCIDVKEFEELADQRFKTEWGSAYSFAIQLLFILIHFNLRARTRLHESVNILIEDGHKNANQAIEIIRNGKGKKGAFIKIGTYGLGPKAGNPILQAADLMAYGCCQALATGTAVNRGSKGNFVDAGQSKMFARLVAAGSVPFAILPWSASTMQAMKKDLDAYIANRTKKLRDIVAP